MLRGALRRTRGLMTGDPQDCLKTLKYVPQMGDTTDMVGPLERRWGRESGGTRAPGDSLGSVVR